MAGEAYEILSLLLNPFLQNTTGSNVCVFWNMTSLSWSTNGCHSNGTAGGYVICLCNHLTNFALLTVS